MPRRGFTLIEVLVSLSIIAILISLAAVALQPSIGSARALRVLTVVRADGQAAQQYAADTGRWPHYAEPRLLDAFYNGGVGLPYFNQQWYWMLALHPYIGDGEHVQNPEAYSPWHPLRAALEDRPELQDGPYAQFGPGAAVGNSITLSTALFTGASMWSEDAPTLDVSQLAPVPADAVAFPSQKVMFFESVPYHLVEDAGADRGGVPGFADRIDGSWAVPAVMVDGSGRIVPPVELPERVINPFYPAGTFSGVLMNTVDGFLGRDF